jgi:hypothetical protein
LLTLNEPATTRSQPPAPAALADYAAGTKNKRWLAISDKRLLVGIRNGQAKVVGIVADAPAKR